MSLNPELARSRRALPLVSLRAIDFAYDRHEQRSCYFNWECWVLETKSKLTTVHLFHKPQFRSMKASLASSAAWPEPFRCPAPVPPQNRRTLVGQRKTLKKV
jgi:hypothetical protein